MNLRSVTRGALWHAAAIVGLCSLPPAVGAQPVVIERVIDLCPGTCDGWFQNDFDQHAGGISRFFFVGNDPTHGREAWVTDGTAAGTRMLADIQPGTLSTNPRSFVTIGDVLFFTAATPAAGDWPAGHRLWRSDGSPAGTNAVDFPVLPPKSVFSVGGYDTIYRTTRGIVMPSTDGVWWIPVDGVAPRRIVDGYLIGGALTEWNGGIYLIAGPCVSQCPGVQAVAALYRFDPPGTVAKIASLSVDVESSGLGIPFAGLAAGPTGVFMTPTLRELWFSNGYDAPSFVKRWPATGWPTLSTSRVVNGSFIFAGRDDDYHAYLWTSDGTSGGTGPLTFFASFPYRNFVHMLGVANGSLVLQTPSRTAQAYSDVPWYPFYAELSVLDANSPLGVRAIRSLSWPDDSTEPSNVIPFDRGLLFKARGSVANSPNTGGYLLWVTDGTTGGTQFVDPNAFGDVLPLTLLSHVNGWTYFEGWQRESGYEIYRMKLAPGYPTTYPTVEVTEYYHAGLDHYFVTADPAEKARLDGGVTVGWHRTGYGFTAYAAGSGAPRVSPVCRFYGRPEAGLDSHFYSASPNECAEVETRFANAWIKESENVFEVEVPDAHTGRCEGPLTPLYRAYNARADVNHRYSVHAVDQKAMQAKGWIPEGATSAGIAMCVPAFVRP